jgi:hypothetical protein
MQRYTDDECKNIDITVCDEDCLNYNEIEDDKYDEEWDEELGKYTKPHIVNHRRRCLYNTSFLFTILFVVGICYWSYYIVFNYVDGFE